MIEKIIRLHNTMESLAEMLTTSNIKFDEIEALGEISPNVENSISLIINWFNDRPITYAIKQTKEEESSSSDDDFFLDPDMPYMAFDPKAEWCKVNDINVWVSSSGLIYSTDNDELLKPVFMNGDYMVYIDKLNQWKRAGVICARAFRILSPNKNDSNYCLEYKDGDRKNIKPDNLVWKHKSTMITTTSQYRFIEDICRRIVEFNGDVNAIVKDYKGSEPTVSKVVVKRIITKELHPNVSDLFFVHDNGNVIPREKQNADGANGLDVSGFLTMSGDLITTSSLLKGKIELGHKLSIDEEMILVYIAMSNVGSSNTKKISKYIKDEFGYQLANDMIDLMKKDNFVEKLIKEDKENG